jgi:hypothetical protein
VARADPSTAAALVREAERLRRSCGAATTPRQAGELAAVRALLAGREPGVMTAGPALEPDETVERAVQALKDLAGSAARGPADGTDEEGERHGLAGG